MTVGVALVAAAALLLVNGFFVLAEFAMVKLRPTQVESLARAGSAQARLVAHVQRNLDEYLSVCQLGITLASIALGFVGEAAFAGLVQPLLGSWLWAHTVAVGFAYLVVSFLHILLGELVPKSLALRAPVQSALVVSRPLHAARFVLWLPLVVMNGSANLVLRAIGWRARPREPLHSEAELRIILEHSQSAGSLSFRQLLQIENVFDLGALSVRDAMRPRDAVALLRADDPWEKNFAVIRTARQTRYPVCGSDELPLGIVHIKDLVLAGPDTLSSPDLRRLLRPYLTVREDTSLETLLAGLQRQHRHMAIVLDAEGRWTGLITLEDVVEELVGTIEDEFQLEPPLFLADGLRAARVVLGLAAESLEEGVTEALSRVPERDLPVAASRLSDAVVARERGMPTLLARGVAVPHARIDELHDFVLVFARSDAGLTVPGRVERAHVLFILITPGSEPRVQLRLLARIAGLLESDYVIDRLRDAQSPREVIEVLRAADPGALG